GLYTMAIVSPRGGGGQQLGVANVACGGSNLAGLAFAFFGAGEADATKIAATVSHEAAHSLGLDHTSDTADLMFPTNQGGDPALVDGCVPLEPDALCTDVHAQFCPSGQQNGVAELTALLGSGEVDTEGPALEIVAPTDGDRFAVGDVVRVEVEATDDIGVEQVKLYRGDTLVGTDIEPPYEWTLDDLDEGVVELRAEGIDVAGQHAQSDVVAIAIGDAELPDDDSGSDEGDGALTISGDAGEVPDDARRDSGCACTQPTKAAGPLWPARLLLLPLLLLLPRTRPLPTKRRTTTFHRR
ncbi:MAG TPA: Ig-like domain-containing protein, partial [Nannocystaceae bacterium]|nr:Ig-like domain-containing protein [Nannocystaceae bacterium]